MKSVYPRRTSQPAMAAPLLVAAALTQVAMAFNMDPQAALSFHGPRGSYFGYAVALLDNDRGTW